MVKISVNELEQALMLIKSTSHDVYVSIKEEIAGVSIQFLNADNQITSITLYDEQSKLFARVASSESLLQTLTKLKKV